MASNPSMVVGSLGHQKARDFLISHIKKVDRSKKNLLMVDKFTPDIDSAIEMYQKDFDNL